MVLSRSSPWGSCSVVADADFTESSIPPELSPGSRPRARLRRSGPRCREPSRASTPPAGASAGDNFCNSDCLELIWEPETWLFETKGLAFAYARTPSGGERKLRIDGLTYGGFKPEQGEPAEQLMRALRENFTGEVIEYVTEPGPAAPGAGAAPGA